MTAPQWTAEREVTPPVPRFAGVPSDEYPWPFAGYAHLPGTTVCGFPGALGGTRLARELGTFGARRRRHLGARTHDDNLSSAL